MLPIAEIWGKKKKKKKTPGSQPLFKKIKIVSLEKIIGLRFF